MRRLMLLLCVAVLAGVFSSTASAASWDPVETIAPPDAPGVELSDRSPGILERQDARGDVVVAWTMDGTGVPGQVEHVELAFKAANGPWMPVERLGGAGSLLADVEMDAAGDVTVAYVTSPPALDGGQGLNVVTRAADGTYGPVETLQPPVDEYTRVGLTGLGVDDAGDVLVVYALQDGPWSAYEPAGGAWQPAVSLQSMPIEGGLSVEGLVMSPDGQARILEAAVAPEYGLPPLAEQTFTPAGGWSPAVPISAPAGAGLGQDTRVLPSGEIVTITIVTTFTSESWIRTIEAASLAPGATVWSAFAPIASLPEGWNVGPLRVAADDAGEIVLSFADEPAPVDAGHTQVMIRSPGGIWGPLQEISTEIGGDGDPQLAVAGDGRAVIEAEVDSTDPNHPLGDALFEREPGGTAWTPMPAPFTPQPGVLLFGGPGHELVGVSRIYTLFPGQQLYSAGLTATLLTTATSAVAEPAGTQVEANPPVAPGALPETSKTVAVPISKAATARASIRLAGKRICRSALTPCRTARAVRLMLVLPRDAKELRIVVQRLHGGRWRGVRVLSLHAGTGTVRVRLPLGRLRLSTAPVHDNRAHPWVIYLAVS